MKQPFLQFYTGDHLRDPGVRSTSLAARGLWTDMLCLMHQSSRRGFLEHPTGLPYTDAQLARMVGHSLEEITPLLGELEDAGVFSRTEVGVVYSRRMERDDRKRQLCSEAGRRGGGNPVLVAPLNGTFKGQSKGGDKGGVKPHISEGRRQKAEGREQGLSGASAPSSAAEAADASETVPCMEVFDLFERECPSLPKLRDRTEARREVVRARWKAARKAQPDRDPREWFAELFAMAEASDFISGRAGRGVFGFDWIVKPANAQKILEGNYVNRQPSASPSDRYSKPIHERRYTEETF